MNISKIQINNQTYNLEDWMLSNLQNPQSAGQFLSLNELGQLDLSDISSYLSAKVKTNDTYYDSLESALTAVGTGTHTLTLINDIIVTKQVIIADGQDITINLNGHNILASYDLKLTSGILAVHHGATLTIDGKGTIYGANPNGTVYAGIVLTVDKTDNDSTKVSKLVVNDGHIVGMYYGIAGNGSNATRGNTELIINGGVIEALYEDGGIGIYQPQFNCITTINNGKIKGGTAIEIRNGNLVINGGILKGWGIPDDGVTQFQPNGNGATSTGCGVTVSQHTTKQPINVEINGGVFFGMLPFAEVNPQKNDSESIDKITIKINNGKFSPTNSSNTPIYSEDKTAFIVKGAFLGSLDDKYMIK